MGSMRNVLLVLVAALLVAAYVVDHNLDEPRPPVYVYDLTMPATAAVN